MSDETEVVAEDEATTEIQEPERLHGALVTNGIDAVVLHPDFDKYVDVVKAVRGDGYLSLIDLCAVDYLTHPGRTTLPVGAEPQRFEIVVQFLRHSDSSRLRLRLQVPTDALSVPSLVSIFPGTEAMEREVFDMFGIAFEGHPDLTRILMPDEWTGHPLRKDYAVGRIPVQFKAAPIRGDR